MVLGEDQLCRCVKVNSIAHRVKQIASLDGFHPSLHKMHS